VVGEGRVVDFRPRHAKPERGRGRRGDSCFLVWVHASIESILELSTSDTRALHSSLSGSYSLGMSDQNWYEKELKLFVNSKVMVVPSTPIVIGQSCRNAIPV
jgi:hypothetical protein